MKTVKFLSVILFAALFRFNGCLLTCSKIADNDRFDCFPENGASEAACSQRGCCWSTPISYLNYSTYSHHQFGKEKTTMQGKSSTNGIPFCFFPPNFPNYNVITRGNSQDGYVFSLQKDKSTFRPNEILKLEARVIAETDQRLRVQIIDPNNARYQVPVIRAQKVTKKRNDHDADTTDYQIMVTDSPFALKVYRKSTKKLM
jgi:lysosomal alpha-glucosidase